MNKKVAPTRTKKKIHGKGQYILIIVIDWNTQIWLGANKTENRCCNNTCKKKKIKNTHSKREDIIIQPKSQTHTSTQMKTRQNDHAHRSWHSCRPRHPAAAARSPRSQSDRHKSAPSIRPARVFGQIWMHITTNEHNKVIDNDTRSNTNRSGMGNIANQ